MNKFLVSLRMLAAASMVVVGSGFAIASPIIAVGNAQPQTWQQGINNGNVTPTTGAMTGPATRFYQQVVTARGLAGYQEVTPVIRAITIGPPNRRRTVLNTTWQPLNTPRVMTIAGASYMYRADPNLDNFIVNADTFSPQGIQDVGIELIDTNGLAAGWFSDKPEIDKPDDYDINVDDDATQGQFDYFSEDAGFSLTNVIEVRFEESAIDGLPFQTPDPSGETGDWDGYNDWQAVPEPGPLAALSSGVLGMAVLRRRKSSRSGELVRSSTHA